MASSAEKGKDLTQLYHSSSYLVSWWLNYRWHNHLDPMVRKSPWNDAEEFVFIEAHKLHGNKWAEIAKMIPGR